METEDHKAKMNFFKSNGCRIIYTIPMFESPQTGTLEESLAKSHFDKSFK